MKRDRKLVDKGGTDIVAIPTPLKREKSNYIILYYRKNVTLIILLTIFLKQVKWKFVIDMFEIYKPIKYYI